MVRRHFEHYYGFDPNRVRVVRSAIDPARFAQPHRLQKRAEWRQEWGIGPDETAALFVAMNYRLKGLDPLFHAVRLLENRKSFRLLVAGSPHTLSYQRLAPPAGDCRVRAVPGAAPRRAPLLLRRGLSRASHVLRPLLAGCPRSPGLRTAGDHQLLQRCRRGHEPARRLRRRGSAQPPHWRGAWNNYAIRPGAQPVHGPPSDRRPSGASSCTINNSCRCSLKSSSRSRLLE